MFEMSTFEIIITLITTVIAYMGFPFYKFYLSKETYNLKFRKKVVFWNSVVVAFLFTLIRIIINGTDGYIINFAPAFTYYCINSLLYARKKYENINENKLDSIDESNLEDLHDSNFISDDEYNRNRNILEQQEDDTIKVEQNKNTVSKNDNKLKVYNEPKKYTLVYLIIICITVISSVGIFSYSNYQKEQLKQEQENERIKKEQKNAQLRQNQLNNCITQAKSNRRNLWNSNCTKQVDGSCTIKSNSGTSEWIEQRYQQDLNNCYQLYGN